MTHQAMYKCKLCGEVFGIGSYDLHMNEISSGKLSQVCEALSNQFEIIESMTACYPHECETGCIGYSDFVGFKRED